MKSHDHDGKVPGMFGGVFSPRSIRDPASPDHRFEPIRHQEKAELGRQTIVDFA
jgi:hypothetical protein